MPPGAKVRYNRWRCLRAATFAPNPNKGLFVRLSLANAVPSDTFKLPKVILLTLKGMIVGTLWSIYKEELN